MTLNSPGVTPTARPKCIAVVHIHGIGDQQRLQDASNLADALDRAYLLHRGKRLTIRTCFEECRGALATEQQSVEYLNMTLSDQESSPEIRLYEVYWAPITGNGLNPREVLLWLVRLGPVPLFRRLAWKRQWRDFQRQHISVARRHVDDRKNEEKADPDIEKLVEYYEDFSSPPPRDTESYRRGSYQEFLRYVQVRSAAEVEEAQASNNLETIRDAELQALRLNAMAKRWGVEYQRAEWRHAFTVLGILLIMAALLLAAFDLARGLYSVFVNHSVGTFLSRPTLPVAQERIDAAIGAQTGAILAFAAFLLSPASKFLRQSVSDLVFWATYSETDEKNHKRQAILTRCRNVLEHVLDPQTGVNQVVINAHSLGSTIAYDTLLKLGRSNELRRTYPLEKITHLITYGSPIDRIYYFFESRMLNAYRYEKVVQDLRGEIYRNHYEDLVWINMYEQGDLISSVLAYPTSTRAGVTPVINEYTPIFDYPEISTCHNNYINSSHYISRLWNAILPETLPLCPPNHDFNQKHARSQTKKQFGAALPAALYVASCVAGSVARWLDSTTGIDIARFLFVATLVALLVNLYLYGQARKKGILDATVFVS